MPASPKRKRSKSVASTISKPRRAGRGAFKTKANGHNANGMGLQAQKSDRKRQAIIDSAVILFSTRGYEGVSLREIARHANLPLSTLCHYFQEKQALYTAALVRAFEYAAARTLPLFAKGGSAEIRMRRLVRLHTKMLSDGYPEIKLIERALVDGHVTPEMQTGEMFDRIREAYKSLFQEIAPVRAAGMRWVEFMEIFTGLIYGVNLFRPVHVKLIAGGVPSSPMKFANILADFMIEKIMR